MTAQEHDDRGRKVIERYIRNLHEHFDSVQIFVTRYNQDEKTTSSLASGSGNFCARKGQIREWIERMDEQDREMERQ